MQALWGEPATACAVFVDGKEAVPFRGVVTHHWLRAKHCTDDAVKARPGREMTKWRGRPMLWLTRFHTEISKAVVQGPILRPWPARISFGQKRKKEGFKTKIIQLAYNRPIRSAFHAKVS